MVLKCDSGSLADHRRRKTADRQGWPAGAAHGMAAHRMWLKWPTINNGGVQGSSKSAHHLDGVAFDCNNALYEDVIVQARKGYDALESAVAKHCAHYRVARLIGLPKDGLVRVKDDDIPSYRLPAWAQLFKCKASTDDVPCTRPRTRAGRVQRERCTEPDI